MNTKTLTMMCLAFMAAITAIKVELL